jgi:carbohydrate kinase (thermoresistant glucokinase family)
MIIIVMGVSGCGKTTIGKRLSEHTGLTYYDADDFHPQSNIDKMSRNVPLTDKDRWPWLQALADNMVSWEAEGGAVLACSALKESYRATLSSGSANISWVFLSGSFDLIKSRMESRNGHYMKSSLLQSQFDALEMPEYGLHISIDKNPGEIVNLIISKLIPHE